MVNAVKTEWLRLNRGAIPGGLTGEKNAGPVHPAAGRTAGASGAPASWEGVRVSPGNSGDEDDPEKVPPMTEELMDYIRGKMQEIYSKIKSGDTEKSYTIGGASYTEKEWERLIEEFDTAEEGIREEIAAEILTAEKIETEHPTGNPKEESTFYVTFITSTGIYCKKEGSEGYKWKIEFDDISQYDQAISVLNRFDSGDNLRFVDNKYFWQDVLSGDLDVDDFEKFWNERAKDDNVDYVIRTVDGVYIDPEAVKYSKYMPPSFVGEMFFSIEELMAFENEKFQKVFDEWRENPGSWLKRFNREHPELVGLKNWIFYGIGYTAEELDEMFRKLETPESWLERFNRENPDMAGRKSQYYRGEWYTAREFAEMWKQGFNS